jgi:tetratricopeptide (TPR) repeat protein
LLHGEVAAALEKLYAGRLDEMAVQLGDHFHRAEDYGRAVPYFALAAERSARIHANGEAIVHYTQAIDAAETVSFDAASLAELRRGRGLSCEVLGEFGRARDDLEAALGIARAAGGPDGEQVEWRVLLDLGKLWASRDYNQTRDYFESALELARRMDDPAALAGSLNWMGNWYANAEHPRKAAQFHQEALEICERLGDPRDLATTLDLLGIANLLGADHSASVAYYDRAITLFRELDDRPSLLSSLMGRGTIVSLLVLLATAPPVTPPDAQRDIEEAIRLAREIHSPPEEAWAHWSLGLLYTVHGQYGRALEVMRKGLRIASEIGHREWMVGNRFALGVLYAELLAPEQARRQLEGALTLAEGLQSQYWIHHVIGALAGAFCLLGDLAGAQTRLESVISAQTPMDTMGTRYCWARRADVALAQDDPALALEVTDRLIATAPGMSPERVITYLWKLRGDALATLGRADEAEPLLRAAVENAHAMEERFLLWRVHASLGRLYHAMNQKREARREFSTARGVIKELAATIPDDALRGSFQRRAYDMLDRR